MKYIYPKKINITNLVVIELKDKFIIKNNSLINLYGIIIKLQDFKVIKEYNNYKISVQDKELEKYDEYLSKKINNYKKILEDNEIKIIPNNKLKEVFLDKKEDLYLNIHYVKKTGFLNIPKISIL